MSDSALSQSSVGNRILAALPPEDYSRLLPHLRRADLTQGQTLHRPGEPVTEVYFPAGSVVSLLYLAQNGAEAEAGVVGNEGVVGVAAFLGGASMPHRAVVQIGGGAVRVPADALNAEFGRCGALHDALLRFTQSLLVIASQAVLCSRAHRMDKRLAHWLLAVHDRAPSDVLPLTHEYIATVLGVRRAGVTEIAHHLQAEGVISYRRADIRVLDRAGLEAASCECYRVVRREQDRLLG